MVGLRDFKSLRVPGADFSELLLFDGDLQRIGFSDIQELRSASPKVEFAHAQEFVAFDGREEMVDLSSEDEELRRKSVRIVDGTRELAEKLGECHVVVHPGGIRRVLADHESLMACLERSLRELGPSRLLLENMPWYYWLRQGQRMVSNVCVSLADLSALCGLVDGFTLDICHGFLSRLEGDQEYCISAIERFGNQISHVHASDAFPPDKEGLQIGEGAIDFSFLRGVRAPILIEVWNGHAKGGHGFRVGIERLRSMEKDW